MMADNKADHTAETPPDAEAGAKRPDLPELDEAAAAMVDELMQGLDDPSARAEEAGEEEMTEEERIARLVKELQMERDEFKDRYMRAVAEAENVRKRAARDKKDAEAYGGTRLARDLLSVHDNLERAMKAADDALRENHASFIEGVELTQRELLNAFAKHKIEPVTPEPGEKFDPNRHQAMFEAPVPGAPAGTIIETMQAGFVIGDRLLRPALVGVAKGDPDQPAAT